MSLCIWTAILLGVIIAGLIIVFSNPLLKFLGTNEEMWQYARNYMLILAVGSPAMLLNYEIACLVRGEGAIKPGLIANFVSTGMNILFGSGVDPWCENGCIRSRTGYRAE